MREFIRLNVGREPKSLKWEATPGAWLVGCWDEDQQTRLKLNNNKYLSTGSA